MIFSELYSTYYQTVAEILSKALEVGTTEQDLQKVVLEHAFSESVLTILPALKTGRWQLMKEQLIPVVQHKPAMPLTLLEKRWLKSIANDPRMQLFDVSFPELEDIEPLFTREDYKIYDQYSDGDPFEDPTYIQNFRIIWAAIKENRPVEIITENHRGKEVWIRFYPTGFEYSLKDDKLRIIATGCRFSQFNMSRIRKCEFYTGPGPWNESPAEPERRELIMEITDERNALERVMLHFAHFEKLAEKVDEKRYILKLKYYAGDETEVLIRILSFGPFVKVLEPEHFVEQIKTRLQSQKSCGL